MELICQQKRNITITRLKIYLGCVSYRHEKSGKNVPLRVLILYVCEGYACCHAGFVRFVCFISYEWRVHKVLLACLPKVLCNFECKREGHLRVKSSFISTSEKPQVIRAFCHSQIGQPQSLCCLYSLLSRA